MKAKLGFLLLVVLLAGCGAATLDTSSDEALQASIKRMGDGLNEADKKAFVGSLAILTMKNAMPEMMQDAMKQSVSGQNVQPKTPSAMMKPLHGLTAQQIITKGREAVSR